jgi:hypothetical protein
MIWHLDDYIVSYNRRTRVLTAEAFEGFDDKTGDELTEVLDEEELMKVLDQYKPGWIGLDGFVELKSYYGDHWVISTQPL